MEINGIAHIQLTVNDFQKSREFYKKLLAFFEMRILYDEDNVFYCIGGKTEIAITPCAKNQQGQEFVQKRVGLHHLCFRLKNREDVDELYNFLKRTEAKIIHPPEEGPWAPNYYSVLFEDPDGIRLEANYVPGKGNLDPSVQLPKTPPNYKK